MSTHQRIKICHIITDLDVGGAESVLASLVEGLEKNGYRNEVISLGGPGEISFRLEKAGVPTRALEMRRSPSDIVKFFKLVNWLKEIQPDIVQTWMYHADFIGGLAARAARVPRVAWNIRHSTFDPGISLGTRLIRDVSSKLSVFIPKIIVVCAISAARYHAGLGYDKSKMQVIPNGVETDRYSPNAQARREIRDELKIPDSALVIGLIARFHPQKDHETFIRAAGETAAIFPDVRFIVCGKNVDSTNEQLLEYVQATGYSDRFYLLGHRNDVPQIMASLDVATSTSSYGEAFPNVVAEAMACGLPCVVTDVGDSSLIVGETGIVVQAGNLKGLISGWSKLLAMEDKERNKLGLLARKRIEERFSHAAMVKAYMRLYDNMHGETFKIR